MHTSKNEEMLAIPQQEILCLTEVRRQLFVLWTETRRLLDRPCRLPLSSEHTTGAGVTYYNHYH